jgi:hypothetical protein
MATEWYYTSAGQQLGPVGSAQIKQLAAEGTLTPNDMVWNQSMTEWVVASRVKGIAFVAAQGPVAEQTAETVEQPTEQAAYPDSAQAEAEPAAYEPATASPMLAYEAPGGEATPVTPRTVELLKLTRPWVLTMTILMFLGAGLILMGAIAMIFIGFLGGGRGGVAPLGVGAAYLAMAALFAAPPVFLARYYSRIGYLMRLRRAVDLEQALEAQKSYWKCIAIMSLVFIGLYIVVVVVAVAFMRL